MRLAAFQYPEFLSSYSNSLKLSTHLSSLFLHCSHHHYISPQSQKHRSLPLKKLQLPLHLPFISKFPTSKRWKGPQKLQQGFTIDLPLWMVFIPADPLCPLYPIPVKKGISFKSRRLHLKVQKGVFSHAVFIAFQHMKERAKASSTSEGLFSQLCQAQEQQPFMLTSSCADMPTHANQRSA